jgi:hypothetical protein
MDIVASVLLLAQGRGEDPDGMSGVVIIVGIVVAVAVLGFVGHLVVDRVYRKNRKRSDIFRRKPHKRGGVGRIR